MKKVYGVLVTALMLALLAAPLFAAEDCIPFDPNTVQAKLVNGNWTVVQGGMLMVNFGANGQANCNKAVNVIKYYKMNSQCFVGRPNPPFQYWLSSGQSPAGPFPGEDCIPFNPSTIAVKQINGRWKIVDGNSWLFDFNTNQANANTAFGIIKKYGSSSICYVGRPNAPMQYLRKDVGSNPPKGAGGTSGSGVVPPPLYSFRITSVTINHTRSRHEDTNHSFVTVFVNNAEAARAVSSEGDHNNGTYHPTVVANVAIPRNSVDMVVLTVANLGVSNWIQKGGDLQNNVASWYINADKKLPSYLGFLRQPDLARDLENFTNVLVHGIITGFSFSGLCDGVVWADSRAFTGEQLFQSTTGGRVMTFTKYFPGLDSPGGIPGCGDNSKYTATWTVSRQ